MSERRTGDPAAGPEPEPQPAVRPAPPVAEHRHRNIQGGVARASVFGASDGLVSNVSLILGVAGANPTSGFVRLAGIAGLIAGAVSMAAGEYVSMKAQSELLEHELDIERRELRRNPNVETVELEQIYQARGVDADTARQMAREIMADPDRALEAHARDELGIDPGALGSPVRAAASSFAAFALGALVPLLPWFVIDGTAAVLISLGLALVAAASIGLLLASFTHRPRWLVAGRQVLIAALAAGVTFGIGKLVGVSTS